MMPLRHNYKVASSQETEKLSAVLQIAAAQRYSISRCFTLTSFSVLFLSLLGKNCSPMIIRVHLRVNTGRQHLHKIIPETVRPVHQVCVCVLSQHICQRFLFLCFFFVFFFCLNTMSASEMLLLNSLFFLHHAFSSRTRTVSFSWNFPPSAQAPLYFSTNITRFC